MMAIQGHQMEFCHFENDQSQSTLHHFLDVYNTCKLKLMENCHCLAKIQKFCQTNLVGRFLKLRSNTNEFIFQEIGYFEFFLNHPSFDFN